MASLGGAYGALSFATWRAQISAAQSAVGRVRSLQAAPGGGPLAVATAALGAAEAAASAASATLLPAVVGGLSVFNGLFFNNASLAMHALLNKVCLCGGSTQPPAVLASGVRQRRRTRRHAKAAHARPFQCCSQAAVVNATVVALPADALAMAGSLNTTLAALDAVYAGV